jgi:hypothetical protein
MPQVGDVVNVIYEPKNNKVELNLDGDDRYNPAVRAAHDKAKREAERQALLSGADPAPAEGDTAEELAEFHEWTPPAKCPECGAPIDPSNEEVYDSRLCPFCHVALP